MDRCLGANSNVLAIVTYDKIKLKYVMSLQNTNYKIAENKLDYIDMSSQYKL
jgi:hypothetical protein